MEELRKSYLYNLCAFVFIPGIVLGDHSAVIVAGLLRAGLCAGGWVGGEMMYTATSAVLAHRHSTIKQMRVSVVLPVPAAHTLFDSSVNTKTDGHSAKQPPLSPTQNFCHFYSYFALSPLPSQK